MSNPMKEAKLGYWGRDGGDRAGANVYTERGVKKAQLGVDLKDIVELRY
jgi:hypothetical protein